MNAKKVCLSYCTRPFVIFEHETTAERYILKYIKYWKRHYLGIDRIIN